MNQSIPEPHIQEQITEFTSQELFILTKGRWSTFWKESGAVCEPGGGAPIFSWREEPSVYVAEGQASRFTPRPRWLSAQKAEASFWRTWRENVLYAHVSVADFWQEVLAKTGGPLLPGFTLDVGSGPVSVLNYHGDPDSKMIGIDPLAETYHGENLLEAAPDREPISLIGLPAEQLPFAEQSFDQLICFNVLDHVDDAPTVLREMHRVLKKGGNLRVYVHTFAPWIKRFLFFDRPHTYHWDHDEFKSLVEKAGFITNFEEKEAKTFDIPQGIWGTMRYFPYWVATKTAFTSYFQFIKT